MTILLVRHAHAGERSQWRDDDRARPLSKRGVAQAEALVGALADHPTDRILTSPFTRCVQSVEPLAAARGLELERTDVLAEGVAREAVGTLLVGLTDQDVALCTHGDVIEDALAWLVEHGADLGSDLRYAKGSTWILEAEGDGIVRGRYVPPPEV